VQPCRVSYPQERKQRSEQRQDGRSCTSCVSGFACTQPTGGWHCSAPAGASRLELVQKDAGCAVSLHESGQRRRITRCVCVSLQATIMQGCGQGSCNPTATGGTVVADLKASSEQSSGGTYPLGFLGAILPPILARPGRCLQGYVKRQLPKGTQFATWCHHLNPSGDAYMA